jgi:hypothetical protein
MTLDTLFGIASALALSGWASLILLPRYPAVGQACGGVAVPAALSIVYVGLIAAFWFRADGGFGSLDAVDALFDSRGLLLAGWLHYLAFDLLIGAWMVRSARRSSLSHASIVPSLLLTFLFGPVGYLAFLGTRALHGASRATEAAS